MALARLLVAWLAAAAVLAAWRALEHTIRGGAEPLGGALRASANGLALEAGLLTLLGGLWFSTLGSGGGWLVFLLVGLLIEVSPRLRTPEARATLAWKPVVGGTVRVMLAGVACGAAMGA